MITTIASEPRWRNINGKTVRLDLLEMRGLPSDVSNLPTEGVENMSLFLELGMNQPPAIWTFNLETKAWQRNSKEE